MPKILAVALVIPFITVAVADTASAQNSNQGNPTILNAVSNLQSSVDALASQVANISNLGGSVTTQLTAITNQLAALTPATFVATGFLRQGTGDFPSCQAVNVGTSLLTVKAELFDAIDGSSLANINLGILPGQMQGAAPVVPPTDGFLWCRFSMVSGALANIRGTLYIENAAGGARDREAR